MLIGPPALRRVTNRSRVGSPRAAKTGAARRSRASGSRALDRLGDMPSDGLHLPSPTLVVHAVGLRAASRRDPVEAGLHHLEERAVRDLLEFEDHQRRGLLRVVDARLDGVGMPAPGEEALGLHALDGDVPRQVLVARVRDLPPRAGPRLEGDALELDPKPAAKLLRVRERPPHTGPRGAEQDLLLDPIGSAHMQPPGCMLARPEVNATVRLSMVLKSNRSRNRSRVRFPNPLPHLRTRFPLASACTSSWRSAFEGTDLDLLERGASLLGEEEEAGAVEG